MPKISVTTLSWSRIAQGGGNVAQALVAFCISDNILRPNIIASKRMLTEGKKKWDRWCGSDRRCPNTLRGPTQSLVRFGRYSFWGNLPPVCGCVRSPKDMSRRMEIKQPWKIDIRFGAVLGPP